MQLVAGVAGAVILGPFGAGLMTASMGFTVGASLYGLMGPKPRGPGPGDLSAPQVSLGGVIPRVYGRVRVTWSPISISEFYAQEHSAGGGKGAPSGPSSYTYSYDGLGILADGSNVIGRTRIWVNKELRFSALAESSAESLQASTTTDYWASETLFTGGSSQLPAPLYEDRVGAANAPANRGMCTSELGRIQCGSSKTQPLIEYEVITQGTQGLGNVFWLVHASGGFDDLSSWEQSSVGENLSGAGPSVYGASTLLNIETDNANIGGRFETGNVAWSPDRSLTLRASGHIFDSSSFTQMSLVSVTDGASNAISFGVQATLGPPQWNYRLQVFDQGVSLPTVDEFPVPVGDVMAAIDYDGDTQTAVATLNGVEIMRYTYIGTPPAVTQLEEGFALYADAGDHAAGALAVGAIQFTRDYRFFPTAPFTPPTGEPEDLAGPWTPAPEDLADVVTAELSLVPGIDLDDWDVSDLDGVEVIGFKAVGTPAQAIAELGDIFYFDLVPGSPNRFVRRGGSVLFTIPAADTGVALDSPSDPFAGMKEGNNDESPAVVGLQFPMIDQAHDPGYETGDRLVTDGPDVKRVQTNVVLTAAMGKGRAIAGTLMGRTRARSASFSIDGIKYAELEPGDRTTAVDTEGNSYQIRPVRLAYADGVKQADWELDDTTGLVETGLTEDDYTDSIEVAPAGVAEFLPLDIPMLREADNDAGHYAAVKVSDDSRGYWYDSPDDANYTERAGFPVDAVFGTIVSITATPTADGFFDERCVLTLSLGDGELSDSTRSSILSSRAVNACAIGAHGRWLLGQFRDASQDSDGFWIVTGGLWGQKGTERHAADVVAGDRFVLLAENAGTRRIVRSPAQLAVPFYVKAVAARRPVASVSGQEFTNMGVGVTPLSPVQLRAERDGSGNITFSVNRRTRFPTRFGGDLGDSVPIGEETETYRWRVYDDNTFTTLVRDLGTTSVPEVSYSAANQTTDFGSAQATVHVRVTMVSAVAGEGYPLEDAA